MQRLPRKETLAPIPRGCPLSRQEMPARAATWGANDLRQSWGRVLGVSKSFDDSGADFEDCRAIFEAAKEDYEGGYLFTVRGLIKAEVLATT